MTHSNTETALTGLEAKSAYGNQKIMKKMLAAFSLLAAGTLIAGNAAADTSQSNQPEAEEFITFQQQQELVDWNIKSQAALTKRLELKLHVELTSMLHPSDGLLDAKTPEIDLPKQEFICAGKPAPVPTKGNGALITDCYVAIP